MAKLTKSILLRTEPETPKRVAKIAKTLGTKKSKVYRAALAIGLVILANTKPKPKPKPKPRRPFDLADFLDEPEIETE